MNAYPRYDDSNWDELLVPSMTEDGGPQCLPRATVYGSAEARELGLTPME
jgi:hypothetical protein